jgi:integrase
MTFDERAEAVAELGFTARQARFLMTVMLHAGVCVPRQYARFCGIVHGQKTRKFFAKLERLGYATAHDCRHNRAMVYLANGIEPKSRTGDARWNQKQLRRIDLRWHDIRHEGACRLLADGVDIRIIQLMLWHASIQQTQRYLNVTDEELRKGLEVSWINQGRPLRAVAGS